MRPWQRYEMTRAERISTSFFHVYFLMLMCSLFYKDDSARLSALLGLDYYSFQWSHVLVGIQSGLLCYPATLVVSYFFRLCQEKESDKTEQNFNELELGEIKHRRKSSSKRSRKRKRARLNLFKEELLRDLEQFENKMKDAAISLLDVDEVRSEYTICKQTFANISTQESKIIPKQADDEHALKETPRLQLVDNSSTPFIDHYPRHENQDPSIDDEQHLEVNEDENKSSSALKSDTALSDHQDSNEQLSAEEQSDTSSSDATLSSSSKSMRSQDENSKKDQIKPNDGVTGEGVTYKIRPGNCDFPDVSTGPARFPEVRKKRNKHRGNYTILKPRKEGSQKVAHGDYGDKHKTMKSEKGKVKVSNILHQKFFETANINNNPWSRQSKLKEDLFQFGDIVPSAGEEEKMSRSAALDDDDSTFKESVERLDLQLLQLPCLKKPERTTQTIRLLSYKRTYRPWPWYCFYIGWAAIIGGSICSVWFTLVIGMEKGSIICTKWLISFLSGMLASVIVFETFHVILLSFVYVVYKRRIHLSDWLPRIIKPMIPRRHKDLEMAHVHYVVKRANNRAYQPRDLDEVEVEEMEKSAERKTRRKIKNMSIHALYLICLLVATMGQRDENFFHFHQALSNMIVDSAKEVSTRTGVYDWMEFSLADALTSGHRSHFTDGQLLVLSVPRIRQKRVLKGQSCYHTKAVVELQLADTEECKESLDQWTEDKRNYKSGWVDFYYPSQRYEPIPRTPWIYATEEISWLSHYYGEHGVYNGEGYVAYFPNTSTEAHATANGLRQKKWIDEFTRLVILEVVFYNVPTRIFCVVNVGIETLNLGTASVTSSMMFMRSHHIATAWDVIVYIGLYSILLIVFYHLFDVTSQLREKGWRFFYNVWNILHSLNLILSAFSVALYLTRASQTDLALFAYSQNRPSYHLFHTSANLAYVTRCLMSTCVFLTMAYTIRVMQGHPVFNLMYGTFSRAKNDLVGHSFYLVFLYCNFCHVGFLLFNETQDFSTVLRTMQVVLGYSMEAYTSSDLLDRYPVLGWTYLLVFVIVFAKCFVNFYVVILENSFREIKLLRRNITGQENVLTFGRKQLRSLFVIKEEKMKDKTKKEKEGYLKMLKKAKKSKNH